MESPVDCAQLSTMRIGGKAKSFTSIKNPENIPKLPDNCLVIGGGSNIVFGDTLEHLTVARMEIYGTEITKENEREVIIRVGAGETWDDFVSFAVQHNLSGIETLSAIPGTVGAAPVQNIGAYGTEVKETIVEVEVYDRGTKQWKELQNNECQFDYRNSIFKRNPKKWIITSVTFRLRKKSPPLPNYTDVRNYFVSRPQLQINLKNIRQAIIEIRKKKLPDPKIIPNCGSFFKNPVVPAEITEQIQKEFSNLPVFPISETEAKIPAGFLIEQAGFKGASLGPIVIYEHNALVLTNPNNASFQDLITAKNKIQKMVEEKFGIYLEPEVNIVEK